MTRRLTIKYPNAAPFIRRTTPRREGPLPMTARTKLDRLLKTALYASNAARELEQAAFTSDVISTADYKLALDAQTLVARLVRRLVRAVDNEP